MYELPSYFTLMDGRLHDVSCERSRFLGRGPGCLTVLGLGNGLDTYLPRADQLSIMNRRRVDERRSYVVGTRRYCPGLVRCLSWCLPGDAPVLSWCCPVRVPISSRSCTGLLWHVPILSRPWSHVPMQAVPLGRGAGPVAHTGWPETPSALPWLTRTSGAQ